MDDSRSYSRMRHKMGMITANPSVYLFLAVSFVAACGGPKIGYDYDPTAIFSRYQTYEWMPGDQEPTGDRRADSPVVDIRIRTAVAGQLRLKGYKASLNTEPDFYVAYHIAVKDMTPDTSTEYLSKGMAGRPMDHSIDTRPAKNAHPDMTAGPSYMTGTLLVDIMDGASKRLVWRGTAAGEIDQGLTSHERDERIRTIIHDMLSHFPPN